MFDVTTDRTDDFEARKREEIARRVEDINAFATCLNHLIPRPARRKPILRVIQGGRIDA